MPIERTERAAVRAGHASTTHGRRRGVIRHVDGRREMVLDDLDGAARAVALEDHEAQRVADLHDATSDSAPVTDVDRRSDDLTAFDWQVLALAMFIAPLAFASVGVAVSRGLAEALVAAVLAVGLLVVYLTRHRR